MPTPQIVLSVNFQERSLTLYSSEPSVEAVLVDWDPGDCPPESPNQIGVTLPDGRLVSVWVEPIPVLPLEELSAHGLDEVVDRFHKPEGQDPADSAAPCDCQFPGWFCSGVPGIIARVQNSRVVPGATVERCDLCCRYPTDEAARQKLVELGMA